MFVDHAPTCSGKLVCKKCGRPGCEGCLPQPNSTANESIIGLCPICTGIYKSTDISLLPIPSEWDE